MTDKHTDTFFDLTHEGWLPCLDREGKPLHQLLGLREIFAQAHELRDINGDSPLVDAALYRLLLAILHRNFQNTVIKRWQELWDHQKFDMRTLDAYFDEWQDQKQRFFLYHPTHPFFQSPKAYGGGDHGQLFDKGVADLMQEVASGDKPTLFNHTIYHKDVDEGNFALSLPEAARLLIAIEAYKLPGTGAKTDVGARASFETAPLVDGILFIARGRTLFETLMLNLLEITNGDPFLQKITDCPCWERDDPFAARNIPDGYIDYLTWLSKVKKVL
jgi:CRISPR system Cascade subunit CasA